jgi:hypothetical protein
MQIWYLIWNTAWLVSFGYSCFPNGQSVDSAHIVSLIGPDDSWTHLEVLTHTELASNDVFVDWVECQMPRDELSPHTAVKQQKCDAQYNGNQAVQITITCVNVKMLFEPPVTTTSAAEKGLPLAVNFCRSSQRQKSDY